MGWPFKYDFAVCLQDDAPRAAKQGEERAHDSRLMAYA
jgi:hypothetical protein